MWDLKSLIRFNLFPMQYSPVVKSLLTVSSSISTAVAMHYYSDNAGKSSTQMAARAAFAMSVGLLLSYALFFCAAKEVQKKQKTNTMIQSTDFASCITALLNLNEKIAAFFDLDNTVLITSGYNPAVTPLRKSGYGSDIWFVAVAASLAKTSPDYAKNFSLFLQEYFIIQHHAQHVTTEPCVPDMITKLHKNSHFVLGITARSFPIMDITLQRTNELGIRFSQLHVRDNDSDDFFELDVCVKEGQPKPVYKNGIIFCSGLPKDVCLDAFFKTEIGMKVLKEIAHVAFMDDRQAYCKSIHAYLMQRDKSSTVVHYTHVEEKLTVDSEEEIRADRERLSKDIGVALRF